MVIEDIHWADPALLDLLQDLADRGEGPTLFLCPARPELTARRPGWGGGRWNHSSLLLEPLSAAESGQLLDLLVERGTVTSDLRSRILERAGGNPFFLEEIVQRLMDEPAGIEWLEIPDTVQGVLAARIDLLTPLEKRALQSASVIGRTFWNGAVRSLLDPDRGSLELDEVLRRLEDRGLVHARIGSTIVGDASSRSATSSRGMSRTTASRDVIAHEHMLGWPSGSSCRRGSANASSPSC